MLIQRLLYLSLKVAEVSLNESGYLIAYRLTIHTIQFGFKRRSTAINRISTLSSVMVACGLFSLSTGVQAGSFDLRCSTICIPDTGSQPCRKYPGKKHDIMDYHIDPEAQTVSSPMSTNPVKFVPYEFGEVRVDDLTVSFTQIAKVTHDSRVDINRSTGAISMDYISDGKTVYAYGGTCVP